MKKNNFKKISVLIGLIGSLSIFKVNAINNNENFFNIRKDVKLLHEDDKIIKWINGSDVTPLEFIRNFLDDNENDNKNELVYNKTERYFITKDSLKCKKRVKVYIIDVLKDILDKFLETNITDYKKTISEREDLKSKIENLNKKKKKLHRTRIDYSYDDELIEDRINDENVDELINKNSRLYDPELYNKLINEKKEKEEKNSKIREYNDEIDKKIKDLERILNDEHHGYCKFVEDLKDSIIQNTRMNYYPYYSKKFLTGELLFKNNHTENMEILEKIIEVAEGQNKNRKFSDLKQKSMEIYKMFLILRKFIEIFNNNPNDFIGGNVIESFSRYAEKNYQHDRQLLYARNHNAEKEENSKEEENCRKENEYENIYEPLYRKKQKNKDEKLIENSSLNDKKEIADEMLKSEEFLTDLLKDLENNSPYEKNIINKIDINNSTEKNKENK